MVKTVDLIYVAQDRYWWHIISTGMNVARFLTG
jgi:hypothetical protein